jgi:hypothetical protein
MKPADRAPVGDHGSGHALSDDQFRLLEPLIPRPPGPEAVADNRCAAPFLSIDDQIANPFSRHPIQDAASRFHLAWRWFAIDACRPPPINPSRFSLFLP